LLAFADAVRKRGKLALDTVTIAHDAVSPTLVGLAVSSDSAEGFYIPMAHRTLTGPRQLGWDAVRRVLGPLLSDERIGKIGYDTKRTENALSGLGVAVAGPLSDVMLSAYLLDPEAPHALSDIVRRQLRTELPRLDERRSSRRDRLAFDELDVDQATPVAAATAAYAFALSDALDARIDREGLGTLYRDVELPLSRVLGAMERRGVLVDTVRLGHIGERVGRECEALELKAHEAAGRPFSLRSRDQLETILFDELRLPVVKRTQKGGRSTDASVLEELVDKHALASIVLEYRELDKLKSTYLDALPRAVNPRTGRIHTHFEQAVAATGRLSSTDPNLQNIPIRTEVGRLVRTAFVAPEGYQIVSADYSQIELRVLAHLAKDAELIHAFCNNIDVHQHTASLVFNVGLHDVTPEMRRRAKAINFGLMYGMGEGRLAREQNMTRDEARRFIDAYFERFVGVRDFMNASVERARAGQAVVTILGRRRFLPNLNSQNRVLRAEAERVAKNTPIQGTAADILKLAMLALGKTEVVPGAHMVLTVHDELVFEVPTPRVAEAKARIREAMESALRLDVPLIVDVGSGATWGDAHS